MPCRPVWKELEATILYKLEKGFIERKGQKQSQHFLFLFLREGISFSWCAGRHRSAGTEQELGTRVV